MTASIPSMTATQRFSIRVIASSGIIPSGSGRCSGFVPVSANGASRYEQEEIKREPADEEQSDRYAGENERAAWAMLQAFRCRLRRHRLRHPAPPAGAGVMRAPR